MLNYTQFFPTGSGGGGASSTPDNRLNRRIFTGELTSCSWPVPPGVTNVEVHVWGGGGGGCSAGQVVDTLGASGGGGGGGYARATLDVTDSDILSITVGGEGQTSSLTVPTQTPGSPISATGGSNGSNSVNAIQPSGQFTYCHFYGGSGGSGSVNLAPTQPRDYCFTASGGTGGVGSCCAMPPGTPNNQCGGCAFLGAGGAAGSPLGPGGNGADTCFGGGGGGIGGPGYRNAGGSKYGALNISCNCPGYYTTFAGGGEGDQFNNIDGIEDGVFSGQFASCFQDTWWKVEDIKGAGGLSVCSELAFFNAMVGGTGAGGGGGDTDRSQTTCTYWQVQGARGGFLGGAGSQVNTCKNYPCSGNPSDCWCCMLYRPGIDGKGGCAGGSSGSPGTPGVVIIYW